MLLLIIVVGGAAGAVAAAIYDLCEQRNDIQQTCTPKVVS